MADFTLSHTGDDINNAISKVKEISSTSSQINSAVSKINGVNYTAAQINSKLGSIDTITNNITTITNNITTINGKITMAQNPTNVYSTGGLIIQRWHVTMDFCNVQTVSFPQAFPNECIWVGIQGTQCGDSGTNGYWGYTSIQCKIISKSQFRMFLMSSANNATMTAMIIAIGY